MAESILRIITQSGVNSLTFARLAKSAGVSRSWLYKYIGKDREALVIHAVAFFGQMFADIKTVDANRSRERWLADFAEGFERLLGYAEAYPGVLRVFFQFQGAGGAIGQCLDELTARHADRERLELTHVMGVAAAEAGALSEALSALRLALAHAWVYGGLRKQADRAMTRELFGRMSAALLKAAAAP